jgi:hypothetical protein
MLELIKSQRFQEEYKTYRARIDSITDANVRSQSELLLNNLVSEVKKIDQQHQEMFTGNQIPMSLGDARTGVIALRKKLDTLLKDWQNRNVSS